jgi:peptidoglycan/LPS O-acetylase OafA/YrhL
MHGHNNRIFGLDLLRAFAILCVVYGHGYSLINYAIPSEIYKLPVFDGVTMFFVLSGFLIGRILIRTINKEDFNGKMLAEFWIRRWFRTIPNYFLVLLFLVMANYFSKQPQPDHLIRYFFFSQNIASPHPDFFSEAWSLTVEEWFYLCIPIPLYLSTKQNKINRRSLILFWIAVVILSVTAFRFYRVYHFDYLTVGDWGISLRKQVITRLDSLMFGVLGAYISLYNPDFWNKAANKRFVIGVLLLLCDKFFFYFAPNMFYLNYFKLSLDAVGTLLMLPRLSSTKGNSGWFVSTVTFISLISYSMYLLNLTPVQGVILPLVMLKLTHLYPNLNQHIILTQYIMYWIITLTCSFLLYRYFERPMTDLRDYYRICDQSKITAFKEQDGRA